MIAVVDSPELAHAFTLDFEQLWTTGIVEDVGQGRAAPGRGRRDRGAAVVLPRLRRRALPPDREGDRPGEAPGADLLAGDHRRARSWRRSRRCSPTARSTSPARVDQTQIAEVQLPVGAQKGVVVEAPAAEHDHRLGRLRGQALDAVGARHAARLHARQGDGRRRRRLLRLVQPLALGRAERRERAGDPRPGSWPSAWPGSWTACGRAIRGSSLSARGPDSLPLDRGGRLRGEVEGDAVHARDLVDDPARDRLRAGRRAGAPSRRSSRPRR